MMLLNGTEIANMGRLQDFKVDIEPDPISMN
jgi:hypothetical protein